MKRLTRDEWTNIGVVIAFLGGVYVFATNFQSMIQQIVQAVKQP